MKQNNIFGKYNDVLNKHDAERSNKLADLVISAGLVLSSLFTLLYMVVAFGGALVGWSWPPAVAVPSEKLVQLVDVNSCVLRPDWLGKFRLPNNYSTVKGLFPELGQNVCSKLCHTPRS